MTCPSQDPASLDLTGFETFDIDGIAKGGRGVRVRSKIREEKGISFTVIVRVVTPQEGGTTVNGGILQCVLRRLNT